MTRVDKKLDRWIADTPKDIPKREVLSMLERFFPDHYQMKSGSHIVVRDDRLKGSLDYGPDWDFDIPVKGGQKVKGFYAKKLAQAIRYLEEMEE